jgi:ribosomal protein L11 methyltransferase
MRAYELRGKDAAEALDWLHVHADLLGALEADDAITVWLDGALPALPFADVTVRELAVDPAAAAVTGLEHDAPITVAADLLVRPPWVERPAGFRGVELVVPRGGAFGSGEHGSTQAALRCLHALWDGPPSFADIGTGSGILALYASVRGCGRIHACDVDPACVAAARELLPAADVQLGGAELMPVVDGLVANMTAAELSASMTHLLRAWSGRHVLVLSGMRAHEVATIAAAIPARVAHTEVVGDFTALGYRCAGLGYRGVR